eukprot:CAMPEP_0167788428 /NCGR_PEP_ID=MMETSP0111_2-20121227/10036_1 /TAXON_ID=91324 /ORGANISM="Lotharella globosa, Strain CCCM811" /LENGTH=439 /DNA_ID=CAMNT_0007680307 /DNA_START=9 /DNA_END=1328 /DNA_ORIENTATION=+
MKKKATVTFTAKGRALEGWRALIPTPPKVFDAMSWPNVGLAKDAPQVSVGTEQAGDSTHALAASEEGEDEIPRIPSMRSLRSTKPSVLLKNNVVDLLYAYAFAKRLYNGDWEDDPHGVANVVFTLSDVLSRNAVFEKVVAAILSLLENAQRVPGTSQELSVWVLRDVALLLFHKTLVVRALWDLYTFLERVHVLTRSEIKEMRKKKARMKKQERMRRLRRQQPHEQQQQKHQAAASTPLKGPADAEPNPQPDSQPLAQQKHATTSTISRAPKIESQEDSTIVLTRLPSKTATAEDIWDAQVAAERKLEEKLHLTAGASAKETKHELNTRKAVKAKNQEREKGSPLQPSSVLDADIGCHEIASKETNSVQQMNKKKKMVLRKKKKGSLAQMAARKAVYFCAWANECFDEANLGDVGVLVSRKLHERCQSLEQAAETKTKM